MDEYKLHTGISRIYKVTSKEDFEEQTGNSKTYQYNGIDGIKRGLGVCPACDNPVRILGIYNKLEGQKPHARHHNRSTLFAEFDEGAYYHCPLAEPSQYAWSDMASQKREPTEYEIRMYRIMRDYFDKAIYILNQDLSIKISYTLAERLLKEFLANKGYMSPNASIYNLPWILIERSFSFNLIGHQIKRNSQFHKCLEGVSEIKLIPYKYTKDGKEIETLYDVIESSTKEYVTLQAHFIQHERKCIDGDIVESIGFGASMSEDVPIKWLYRETYEINLHRFPNLCEKGKNIFRDKKLLDIARNIMKEY